MKILKGKPETVVEYFAGSAGRSEYHGYFRYCPNVNEEENTFRTSDFEVVVSTVDGINMKDFSVAISKLSSVKERPAPIHMIVQNRHGLDIQDFSIQSQIISINENYEDFEEKHEYLMERLLKGTRKGICLLHGEPGTGKSMYIRHIVDRISKEKTVIYIPNQLISCLTDPGFIPLMAEHSNSVIVIEDADEAIKSRETGGATVDKLLNMADGIVSDFLGMQIICTFNTDINNIDTALLRKGRLIFKHEFKRLSSDKATALSAKIGANKEYEKPTTLAEIYNDADQFQEEERIKRKIGF
jgi:SpoVK/Ycf46/Vps4 family AAA+-type ATPase